MNKLPKCEFCNKPLSMNNCVIFHMVRWENGVRYVTSAQTCKDCYDKGLPDEEEKQA